MRLGLYVSVSVPCKNFSWLRDTPRSLLPCISAPEGNPIQKTGNNKSANIFINSFMKFIYEIGS
jgi:hypothetical protein